MGGGAQAWHHLAKKKFLRYNVSSLQKIHPPSISISESTMAVIFRQKSKTKAKIFEESILFVTNWRTGSNIYVSPSFPVPPRS